MWSNWIYYWDNKLEPIAFSFFFMNQGLNIWGDGAYNGLKESEKKILILWYMVTKNLIVTRLFINSSLAAIYLESCMFFWKEM